MSRRGRTERVRQIATASAAVKPGYFERSMQPLHILVFILPFMICFELGLMGFIGSGGTALEAHRVLVRFFDLFGAFGLHLPAIALVTVLVVQHVVCREKWTVSPKVLFVMLVESAVLTVPLIVLVMVLDPVWERTLAQAVEVENTRLGGLMLAFGAGIYEEMLFRLVMITTLHFLLADTLGVKKSTSAVTAVILSSIAFMLYHDQVRGVEGLAFFRLAAFYTLAGLYFGTLFLWRGFGIAVGVHLLYDLLVLVVLD